MSVFVHAQELGYENCPRRAGGVKKRVEFCPRHSSPRRLTGEKKSTSYNHKTTIWVSHEYYLNPEFHKILSRAFRVIVILRFFPYVARVDFKGLISK